MEVTNLQYVQDKYEIPLYLQFLSFLHKQFRLPPENWHECLVSVLALIRNIHIVDAFVLLFITSQQLLV